MSSVSNESALAALGDTPYVSLATWRKNGKEVRTAVWVARAGSRLYVFTEGTAGKVKRLRNSPRSAVAPCDVRGKLKGDFVAAQTVVVEDPTVVARAYEAFRAKYGWQVRLTDFMSKLSGRYDKRAMLEIELVD